MTQPGPFGSIPVSQEIQPPTPDMTAPSLALLCKLGSITRHVQEAFSASGRAVDLDAIRASLDDPELQEWMAAMDRAALLPVPR